MRVLVFFDRIREADDPTLVAAVGITSLRVNWASHSVIEEKLGLVQVAELRDGQVGFVLGHFTWLLLIGRPSYEFNDGGLERFCKLSGVILILVNFEIFYLILQLHEVLLLLDECEDPSQLPGILDERDPILVFDCTVVVIKHLRESLSDLGHLHAHLSVVW